MGQNGHKDGQDGHKDGQYGYKDGMDGHLDGIDRVSGLVNVTVSLLVNI